MRKIDLIKAMRTFHAVVDLKSFTAASRQLNLVTSAVSRQVSDLEAYYDCQLLYRTTRAMHLTAEGQYYLERFKEVLSRLDDLESDATLRKQSIAGHVRITAPQNSWMLGIHKAISEFLLLYPEVKLTWLLVNRYVNLIEEGIDLAIRVGELPDSTFIARKYMAFQIVFAASPGYLTHHGTPSVPADLADHRCVLDSSNRRPGRWRYLDEKGERHISVTGAVEINQGELVAQFAADGHGVCALPDFLVQPYLERGELVSILEPYQIPVIPVSLVYPANRMMNPALRALIHHLLNKASSQRPARLE